MMKKKLVIILLSMLIVFELDAQTQTLKTMGKIFAALSVSNTDSASAWYQEVLDLKLLKEIKPADGSAHVRIIGNNSFMLELVQIKNSKSLTACSIEIGKPHLLRGIFKIGFFVADVVEAEKYFKRKGVAIKHSIFEDTETGTKSFIIEDSNGNLLQAFEDVDSKNKQTETR